MRNFDFNLFDVEDITWTLKNFSSRVQEWENKTWVERIEKEDEDPYVLMAYAALITLKHGCGECFDIEGFIELVNTGFFIHSDGCGEWVDMFGNDLGAITCDVDWLKKNQPERAAFIMWYNK